MSEKTLLIENLKGGYLLGNKYVDAVSNITMLVKDNEVLGIAGESGCGKSTLIKMIYGYIKYPLIVKNGKVNLKMNNTWVNILKLNEEDRRKNIWWKYISYIPQNSLNVLNPTSRIKDHFAEILSLHRGLKKEEAYELASEYLKEMELPIEVLNAYPHQLSGGMRQRVVIALALLLKPRLILADEPTTALDVIIQRGILTLLLETQRKLKNTLILVTHDMGIHAMLTDRIAIMYAGKIIEVGGTKEIFNNPLHPYTKILIESLVKIGEKKLRRGIKGMPPNLTAPPSGCRFHPRCPLATEICSLKEPYLIKASNDHFVACHKINEGIKL